MNLHILVLLLSFPSLAAANGDWVAAADLRPGDQLLSVNGEIMCVVNSLQELHEEGVEVFNSEVEGFHTYNVSIGSQGPPVLVHNSCRGVSNVENVKLTGCG